MHLRLIGCQMWERQGGLYGIGSVCIERGNAGLCRKCEGHEDAVRVLAVASGKVFSGSYDGTIGVW